MSITKRFIIQITLFSQCWLVLNLSYDWEEQNKYKYLYLCFMLFVLHKTELNNKIKYSTYQLKPNSMESFNFWHGHVNLLLDFELEFFSFCCLLLLKISSTSEDLFKSPSLWLLFRLQFLLQELSSIDFNSERRKTSCYLWHSVGFRVNKKERSICFNSLVHFCNHYNLTWLIGIAMFYTGISP